MPLCDMLLRHDMISNLCSACDWDAKLLCAVMAVNRVCRKYLNSEFGRKHWSKLAFSSVGDDSLHMIRPGLPNIDNTKYACKLTMCPWLSAHCHIYIYFIGDGRPYRFQGAQHLEMVDLKWKMHCTDGSGMENCIVIDAYVDAMRRVFTVPLRPRDVPTFIQRVYAEMPADINPDDLVFKPEEENRAQLKESRVLRSIDGESRVLFSSLHESVDAISEFHNADYTGSLIFVNSTTGQFLRRLKIEARCSPPMLSRPAELWTMDGYMHRIRYYGPRADGDLVVNDMAGRAWPAFVNASQGHAEDALAVMRSKGANLSQTLFDKREPLLMVAVRACKRLEVSIESAVLPILDAKAFVNATDRYTGSVLSVAITTRRLELVQCLLSRGAQIQAGDLHRAVAEAACDTDTVIDVDLPNAQMQILNMVLARVTDIDELYDGNTALIIAAVYEHNAVAEILLRRGADPDIRDCAGKTALETFNQVVGRVESPKITAMRRILGRAWVKRWGKKYLLFLALQKKLTCYHPFPMPGEPPHASPPPSKSTDATLRKKLESKSRHSKQNKALMLLARAEKKKLAEENRKLKEENAELRSRLERFQPPKDLMIPITPKHALVCAGFFNVHHNDVLKFTPALVSTYESETGKSAIRRERMTVCFPVEEREVVVSIVERLAPTHLPGYLQRLSK